MFSPLCVILLKLHYFQISHMIVRGQGHPWASVLLLYIYLLDRKPLWEPWLSIIHVRRGSNTVYLEESWVIHEAQSSYFAFIHITNTLWGSYSVYLLNSWVFHEPQSCYTVEIQQAAIDQPQRQPRRRRKALGRCARGCLPLFWFYFFSVADSRDKTQ